MGLLEKRCVAEEALRVVVARVSDVCVPYALLPLVVVAVEEVLPLEMVRSSSDGARLVL